MRVEGDALPLSPQKGLPDSTGFYNLFNCIAKKVERALFLQNLTIL